MQIEANRRARRVALIYAGVAGAWITFSDELLKSFIPDSNARINVSILKGWAFVLLTGGLLHLLLRRWLNRSAKEVEQREHAEAARAEAGEKLRQSEAQLRLVLDASADGFWDWNLLTDEAYLSPRYVEIIGFPTGKVSGAMACLKRLVHPEDWPAVQTRLAEHFAGKPAPSVCEYRIVTEDGTIKWVWVRGKVVERKPEGTPVRMVGAVSDITDLKQAELRLRASEEHYRQLFDLESDAIVLVDCETRRFIDANQSAQQLYGFTREEFLQMTAENISAEPEKTRGNVGSGFARLPLRWHRKKGGAVFPVEITANIIEYQGRRTELTAIRDITERQQALKRFQETNAQLLEAQYIARLGSYKFDVTNGNWTGSEALDELFGISDPNFTKDLAGWLKIVHPDDRAEMRSYLHDQVLEGKVKFNRAYRIIRLNDQKERWVHGLGKLVFDDHGRVAQMVGIIQDITDRKYAEEKMNLQSSALTAVANAIVICDKTGRIEWVNPAFTTLTGYSADEAVGNNPRVLNSGQHPPAFYATMWATVLTGNVWHGELINKRKNQELYTEEMTITPVRGSDGQIAHFIAIKLDVTERRQLENRLQQAQKMEAIGTLAGGIAHDFNNILAVIFGFGHLLREDTAVNGPAQESVVEILAAATRAKDLVQQILTFSRKREQNRQIIRLDTVVKEALKFLRASLPANIQIEKYLAEDAPAVLADPTQIYQVTINLATNALHAMETRPGRLTVSLDSFVPTGKFLQAHADFRPGAYARLTVSDTGMGMDAALLGRIFEPFFTTKPIGKGTGLGLAVVHGIVQTHEGAITVESQPGHGAAFSVYFPAKPQAPDVTDPGVHQIPRGRGENILLVDDEPALTRALEHILQRLGYAVTSTNQARTALKLFHEHPTQYDVMITDLTMPEMNGLELIRQVRAIRLEMPVILISGYNSGLTQENLRTEGVSELLEKPINIQNLAEVLQRSLAASKTSAAA